MAGPRVAQGIFLEEEGPEWSFEGSAGFWKNWENRVARWSIFQEASPGSQPHPQPHCPGTAQLAVLAPAGAN